tara:strand:+ start:447 stop:764 length:318 start_codon:yes stop_codon:yes gene_type:complete
MYTSRIPDDARPPLLNFSNESEFQQELSKHEHAIHIRSLYAIKYAYEIEYHDDVTIAFLNNKDTVLGCHPDDWVTNLQRSLAYFVSIEDYEKCTETKEIIENLQS